MVTFEFIVLQFFLFSIATGQDVHFGDIKIIPCQSDADSCKTSTQVIGTLMVYYGSDTEMPSWKPVCNDALHDSNWKTSTALCNMVGYNAGEPVNYNFDRLKEMKFVMPTDYALTQLDCTESMANGAPPTHLLRCGHKLYTQDVICGRPIMLKCSEPKGTPLYQKEYAYDGQVRLCPPDNIIADKSYPAIQISFGIVSVYLNSLWGSVNENSSTMLGYNQANSICKQLGFTGAERDSTRTVSTYSAYDFSHCQSPRNDETGLQRVWVATDNTARCKSGPCSCFSCCYKKPADGEQCPISQDGRICPLGHCCRKKDVVIQCTYDRTVSPPPPSGTSDSCSFESGQNTLTNNVCSQQQSGQLNTAALVAAIILGTILVPVIFILGYCTVRAYKRRGYVLMGGDDGGDHGNEAKQHGQEGNGKGHAN